jgi:hypothetical protein
MARPDRPCRNLHAHSTGQIMPRNHGRAEMGMVEDGKLSWIYLLQNATCKHNAGRKQTIVRFVHPLYPKYNYAGRSLTHLPPLKAQRQPKPPPSQVQRRREAAWPQPNTMALHTAASGYVVMFPAESIMGGNNRWRGHIAMF